MWTTAIGIAATGVSPAFADDRADAQRLFDEAMKSVDAKDYQAACPKLDKVVKLIPGKVGASIELARCYDKWGKTASAWRAYGAVVDIAAKTDARMTEAKKRREELGAHLPTLRIQVPAPDAALPGFKLEKDGVDVDVSQANRDDPSDPGHYTFSASATDKQTWSGSVDVAASGPATIAIPALEDVTRAPPPPPPPPPARRPLWPAAVGYGVTAALVGVGIGSLVAANAPPDFQCAPTGCPAGDAYQRKQNLMSNLSLGSFIGAGVAASASTGLLIWALKGPRGDKPAGDEHAHFEWAPLLSPSFAGVAGSATF